MKKHATAIKKPKTNIEYSFWNNALILFLKKRKKTIELINKLPSLYTAPAASYSVSKYLTEIISAIEPWYF